MTAPTIDLTHLHVHHGKLEAVRGLDLHVSAGRVLGLLGPNGAGKTTTLQALAGIIPAQRAEGTVLGVPLGKMKSSHYARLGYVSEGQQIPLHWTVPRLLGYLRPLYPTWDEAYCQRLLTAYDLPMNRPLSAFSRGQVMKAKLIGSLAYRPELLLLDEPFSGLDAVVREDFIDGLLQLMTGGDWTVVITSHELDEMERLCDDVCLLANGQAVLSESLANAQARFRRWEITLSPGTSPPTHPLPDTWLQFRQQDRQLRFIDSQHDAATSLDKIHHHFGPTTAAESHSLSLREIYVALVRTNRTPTELDDPQ